MSTKYQVFISSTYDDLFEERNEAISAILDYGHLPAGMELFGSGEPVWKTITKWMNESDIYLLILGGRYGSIEKGEKYSYIEREFRYAEEIKMPIMVLYLSEDYLKSKKEKDVSGCKYKRKHKHKRKYKRFKKYVSKYTHRTVRKIEDIQAHMGVLLQDTIERDGKKMVGFVRNTFKYFKDDLEADTYIVKRIYEAESRVIDFSWKDNYHEFSKSRNEPRRQELQKNFEKAIACKRENVDYREIFTFPSNREERYKKMLKLIETENYYCGFYETGSRIFPKLHIVIIDDEEVIFDAGEYEGFYCSTTDKNIVAIMKAYADEAWNLSEKVKDLYGTNLESAEKEIEKTKT